MNGCAFLNGKAAGEDIAVDDSALAKLDAARSVDVTVHQAEDDEVADVEVSLDPRVRTDRETAVGKRDGAFERTVEKKILAAGEFSLDIYGLTYQCGSFGWFHRISNLPDATVAARMKRTIPIGWRVGKRENHAGASCVIQQRARGQMITTVRNSHLGRGVDRSYLCRDFSRICHFRAHRMACTLGSLLLTFSTSLAQGKMVPHSFDPLSVPARQWASDAAKNELGVLQYSGAYLRYRMHVVDSKGNQVRDVIESKDGPVARLIYKEGRPLTPQEDADERERLQAMLDSPSAFSKHINKEQSGKKMGADLLRQMPDAMNYSYVEGQPQRAHAHQPSDAPEIVLDFQPNPAWSPTGMVAEALTGLKGRLWIDARTHYLTRLEGNVFQGVNVGFGALAHIYPGGKFVFEQTQVTDKRWIFSHFAEQVTVRALLLKTIKENTDVEGSNHAQVPTMGYQDAIRLLLSAPLPR